MAKEYSKNSENLAEVFDLTDIISDARENDTPIDGLHIKNLYLEGEDLSYLEFVDILFEGCRFLNCDFEKSSFVNVKFSSCDFSNSNFFDVYFRSCDLKNCKLVGVNFSEVSLKEISAICANFMYSAFSDCLLSKIYFESCDFSESSISLTKLKAFEQCSCKFLGTNFFGTSLAGIDFSDSMFSGVKVSDNFRELKNAVFSSSQAADLAMLLGIKIK